MNTSTTMAIPARLSLWLGVIFIIYGYTQRYGALTIIGCLFVLGGAGLWWRFRSKDKKLKNIDRQLKDQLEKGQKALQSLKSVRAQPHKGQTSPSKTTEKK